VIVKLVLATLGAALLAAVTTGVIAAASTRNETVACLDDATKVLQRIAADPPNGIPEEVTAAAKCVAVVPRLLKGRFRLTAPRGKGVVTCRNLEGWSAPAFFTFSDGLWLPRGGVTDMSLVSAIGGPIGRHVAPGNYYRLNREMLTYSISKRALAPVSLEGATIREDRRSLVAIYGRAAVMQAALSGRLPVPPAARSFLAVVDGIVHRKSIP
jgi:lipid-binding SYLF domain-containing protein